jgi:hypothetical protein
MLVSSVFFIFFGWLYYLSQYNGVGFVLVFSSVFEPIYYIVFAVKTRVRKSMCKSRFVSAVLKANFVRTHLFG